MPVSIESPQRLDPVLDGELGHICCCGDISYCGLDVSSLSDVTYDHVTCLVCLDLDRTWVCLEGRGRCGPR